MTDKPFAAPPLFTRGFVSLLVAQLPSATRFPASSCFQVPDYKALVGPREIGLVTAAGGAATSCPLRYGRPGGPLRPAAFPDRRRRGHGARVARLRRGRPGRSAHLRAPGGSGRFLCHGPRRRRHSRRGPGTAERLGQAIGIFGLAMLSMNAVAPTIVETVPSTVSWSAAFVSAAGGRPCAWFSPSSSRSVISPSTRRRDRGLFEVARRPKLLLIGSIIGIVGAAFGSVVTFSQPWALAVGIEKVRGLFIAYAAAAIVARIGLGRAADRLGRYFVSAASPRGLQRSRARNDLAASGLARAPGVIFGFSHACSSPRSTLSRSKARVRTSAAK